MTINIKNNLLHYNNNNNQIIIIMKIIIMKIIILQLTHLINYSIITIITLINKIIAKYIDLTSYYMNILFICY
jgi:hypothetical protein